MWKDLLGDSTPTLGVDRSVVCELMPHPHAYPDITLRNTCGWGPPPRHSRREGLYSERLRWFTALTSMLLNACHALTRVSVDNYYYRDAQALGVQYEASLERQRRRDFRLEEPPPRINDATPSKSAVLTDVKCNVAKLDGSCTLFHDYSESSRSDEDETDSLLNTRTIRRGEAGCKTKSSFSPRSKQPVSIRGHRAIL